MGNVEELFFSLHTLTHTNPAAKDEKGGIAL